MILTVNKELWEKIVAFDFDDPVSEYGFSIRLASENYWTRQFTETAILEYKKFMYLAATSDSMISPSGIVDTVWHQHLIFTQSYAEFCNVIGKQVQHIPSTHNRDELEKFRQSKERTKKIYHLNFGEPKEIWEYADMYENLELPKAKLKIRSFVLLGMLVSVILIVPFYFLLRPVYIHVNNPYFILCFIPTVVLTFILLEMYNRRYLAKAVKQFKEYTFIYKLKPLELGLLKNPKALRCYSWNH